MDKIKSILLVEDNEDDIDLTLISLKKNRIANRVDIVRDGAEALEYLFSEGRYAGRDKSEQPAVVLLDLNLPIVNGLEVLAKIRSDEKTKRLPVVIFTTSNEEKDLIGSYNYGANSYVRKPVDMDQFNDAIRQLGMYWVILNEIPPVTA